VDRREFLGGVTLSVSAAPPAAEAQPAGKLYRIGSLELGSPREDYRTALPQGLRALGWIESQNLVIEYRSAEGRPDRLTELARQLVGLNVDVIFAGTQLAATAARHATATIPIVVAAAGDPVGGGLAASLARPGGNVTGLAALAGPEIMGKLLQLLKEVVPTVDRVAVLRNPSRPYATERWREIQAAARELRVTLLSADAKVAEELDPAFQDIAAWQPGALLQVPDAFISAHRQRVLQFAANHRLPAMYGLHEFVREGGLIAYGPSIPDLYRRAAGYVDRILKGAKPGDLPIEQATKFELVVNLRTAKTLGLTIPPAVLARADEVIQ
jgi:putative ABC transport system substrate-binding protein